MRLSRVSARFFWCKTREVPHPPAADHHPAGRLPVLPRVAGEGARGPDGKTWWRRGGRRPLAAVRRIFGALGGSGDESNQLKQMEVNIEAPIRSPTGFHHPNWAGHSLSGG